VPDVAPDELNIFTGYPHRELTDEEYARWADDDELMRQMDTVMYHFDHILANGDEEFAEY